eukprot:CAMPEP_0117434698 /NCGR_PEP_ID=MMETSP0759-20121206/85_1 /TAXON_ID=63605 /ORGANISM="Percolomonas cosmopolitus, Strain WS" /LENGTH=229 /DNA_ID=CAMNT_0005226193 /DNA_START=192 /DNA_END=877 /DNA_ORIENTATION=+
MLGGLHQVHQEDVSYSRQFLRKYWRESHGEIDETNSPNTCLDVGAGIGRVSKNVLINVFPRLVVDFLEPNQDFCKRAMKDLPRVNLRNLFCTVAQNFSVTVDQERQPQANVDEHVLLHVATKKHQWVLAEPYDLIWIQWAILYVEDSALIHMLSEFGSIGSRHLVIKCNTTRGDVEHLDEEDGSIIRSEKQVRMILHQSGWKVLHHTKESYRGFEDLFPVHTFGCVREA